MPQPNLVPMARLMDARLDQLIERLVEEMPQISPYYASLSLEQRRSAAANIYKIIRASLEEEGIVFFGQAITKVAHDRIAQGGSAEDLRHATQHVSRINLSLVDELAHNEPSAAVPAFAWLDQLSTTSLQVFTQLAQESLAQQAEELNISIALSERLEQAQRMGEVVEAVFEQLPRLGVDRAIMSLSSADSPLHEIAGVFDRDESVPAPTAARFSPEPLLHDVPADALDRPIEIAPSDLPDDLRAQLAPPGIQALVGFVLRDGSEPRGLLILGYRQQRQPGDDDQRFLALLARMLRNRIANLLLVERLQEQVKRTALFGALVEQANDMVLMSDLEGTISYANRAAAHLLEVERPEDLVGQQFGSFVAEEDRVMIVDEVAPRLSRRQSWKGSYTMITAKGGRLPVESSSIPLFGDDGALLYAGGIIRDERERLALIESLRQGNAEQQHMLELLRQLSTPLVPVMEGILVMPIVGEVDTHRALQIMETLLQGVTRAEADTIILDITGVPVVDTGVANALVQAARAVRLLGAQAILVGITPEVAQTLIGLGVDLRELVTRGDLQSGIMFALQQRGYSIQRSSASRAGQQP